MMIENGIVLLTAYVWRKSFMFWATTPSVVTQIIVFRVDKPIGKIQLNTIN